MGVDHERRPRQQGDHLVVGDVHREHDRCPTGLDEGPDDSVLVFVIMGEAHHDPAVDALAGQLGERRDQDRPVLLG
jgi:hypothetical protein